MPELQFPRPSAIELARQYSVAEMPRIESDIVAEQQAQRALFSLPAEFVEASAVVICSIYPEPLHSMPFHHGGMGRKIYSIDAGSPEQPATLIVKNTWDWTIVQEGQNMRGNRQTPISSASIATDLIRHWTGDHPANRRGKKGIGIIKGKFNDKLGVIEPTPEEIADLVKTQQAFLAYLVERMDQWWDSGQREKVAGCREGKKALIMLGLDQNQHPWFRSKVQLYNDCPFCNEKISVQAIFCKVCHRDIVDYFLSRDITPDRGNWPKVYEEIERLTASKSHLDNKSKVKA